ncbi:hypothetical protein RUM8411_03185 [Ruegeria meonggei]|uniref:Transposase n=1 Tax=Ruegeria meonggei TaxID=1446476 RepID=A0A1X6ZWQ7_9RHOB|nr:hypothetical protein RUM8411_03185 [Ruegeria meonggei]
MKTRFTNEQITQSIKEQKAGEQAVDVGYVANFRKGWV